MTKEVVLWRLGRQPLLTEIEQVYQEAERLFGSKFDNLRLDYRALVVCGTPKGGGGRA